MIIEIKKELRDNPELLENDTIAINADDSHFLTDCEEQLEMWRETGYDNPTAAIARIVWEWENAELERLGILQKQNW